MRKMALIVALSASFTGCASVPMETGEASEKAKTFAAPAAGSAGLYVYRDSVLGKAQKMDVWVDGKCLGESAGDTFFYTQVKGGMKYEISTESEFSPNKISLMFEAGKNHFVRQYIKLGVVLEGADLEVVPEDQAKAAITKLNLAKPGTCSQ
ncbi:MAG: DUF2846 domain-containing protein [Comamonadaceae bacterium]|nr:MAG: DUF2846 domain-containing protein [Comamonadaceae bacterium]